MSSGDAPRCDVRARARRCCAAQLARARFESVVHAPTRLRPHPAPRHAPRSLLGGGKSVDALWPQLVAGRACSDAAGGDQLLSEEERLAQREFDWAGAQARESCALGSRQLAAALGSQQPVGL